MRAAGIAAGAMLCAAALLAGTAAAQAPPGKMPPGGGPPQRQITAQQLAELHLQSLGPPAARAAVKTRQAAGTFQFSLRDRAGEHRPPPGKATLSSEGARLGVVLKFGHPDYDHEAFAFDGQAAHVSVMQPGGSRSPLGQILYHYEFLLREGLVGGVLRVGWLMHDVAAHESALTPVGVRPVDGRPLVLVQYKPPQETDLEVLLCFDPQTGRHVRSQYKVTQDGQTFQVEEVFEAFREFDGLTLPTRWLLRFTASAGTQSVTWSWDASFDSITANQPVAAAAFKLP